LLAEASTTWPKPSPNTAANTSPERTRPHRSGSGEPAPRCSPRSRATPRTTPGGQFGPRRTPRRSPPHHPHRAGQPSPPPRRAQSPRGSRLNHHQTVIDTMLARPPHPKHRTTIQAVHNHLTKNLKIKVSFSAVSAYVRERRRVLAGQDGPDQIR
jgi:hypothetical protein